MGAHSVHVAGDWSSRAQRRRRRLEAALAPLARELMVHEDTVAVVPPRSVLPQGKDHVAVFSPSYRRSALQPRRALLDPPARTGPPRGR